jgi:hypothetical protein
MSRSIWFLIGLASSCWLPALAFAQSSTGTSTSTNVQTTGATSTQGGLAVTLKKIGDKAYQGSAALRNNPIGGAQCSDDNVNLVFQIAGFATGNSSPSYVEIYKGTSCNTVEGKDGVGDDDCDRIKYITRNRSTTIEMINIPLMDLCNDAGNVTLWFLPVDTLGTNASVTPYGVFEVPIDTIPPNAPVNVKGGAGETQICITWKRSDSNISRNWVIWDPKPITPGLADAGDQGAAGSAASTEDDAGTGTDDSTSACSSSLMKAGAKDIDPDHLPKGLYRKEIARNVESAELSGNEIDSPRAAVAIIAQDLAGNRSALSNIACIEVVDTVGFWDSYKDNGGDADGGCTCSLPGARPTDARHAATGIFATLALLGLAVVRVRRKRHS